MNEESEKIDMRKKIIMIATPEHAIRMLDSSYDKEKSLIKRFKRWIYWKMWDFFPLRTD